MPAKVFVVKPYLKELKDGVPARTDSAVSAIRPAEFSPRLALALAALAAN